MGFKRSNQKGAKNANPDEFHRAANAGAALLEPAGIKMVWDDFLKIADAIEAHPSDSNYIEPDELKRRCKAWAEEFKKQTFVEDVIPYIHGKKEKNILRIFRVIRHIIF